MGEADIDKRPELTSIAVAEWAELHGVELEFIRLGKPDAQRIYRTI
jgi:hypothetical protein